MAGRGEEVAEAMTRHSLLRGFLALWWTAGVVLLVGSVETFHGALGPKHHAPVVAVLAAAEAVSALLFLVPRTLRVGAAGLLLTLGVAMVVHLFFHQFRWDLLLDAAAVAFVAVPGNLSGPQWKQAGR